MSLLQLEAVHTHIGAYHILQGVDFDVPTGQYRVELGFAEIFWTQENQRKFKVILEDQNIGSLEPMFWSFVCSSYPFIVLQVLLVLPRL